MKSVKEEKENKSVKEEKDNKKEMLEEEISLFQERTTERQNIEKELIDELAVLRHEKGLSQRELCCILNLKQPALAKIERRRNSPQLNTLVKILDALGYHIEFKKNKSIE